MANPEDADSRDALRRAEGPLARFFDAARAEERTDLSPAFLAALLADADAARPRPRAPRLRDRLRSVLGERLAPLGGWGGAGLLAGCLGLGFVAGALGAGSGLAAGVFWAEVAALDASAAGLDAFLELTGEEG